MRFQILFFITILSFTFIFAGCTTQPAANNSAENKTTNTNTAPTNSNGGIVTTKTPEASTTNAAPTLAPVVQSYYDALKKKDDAAVRKVLSQSTIKATEADMKSEKKTSLSAFIAELEKVPEKSVEVRNEKIEGDTGIAEIKGGSYDVWTPIKFVKENGEWKMTNESPDLDSIKKTANSNPSK